MKNYRYLFSIFTLQDSIHLEIKSPKKDIFDDYIKQLLLVFFDT